MADATLKKLIHLIATKGADEPRRAALTVAAVLGNGDQSLADAVQRCLADEDAGIRMLALEAVGRLRIDSALPRLIQFAEAGGPELESAARAAGRLGAKGVKAMEKVMAGASPVPRRRIAAALAEGGTASAETAAAHALLDPDPGVVDAAARSLAAELPAMSPAHRKALADHLVAALQDKKKSTLPVASEAAMLRVLSALHEPRAEPLFWSKLDSTRPALVRAAALQGLGAFAAPKADGKIQQLLQCACDSDFLVAAPALMILEQVAVPPKKVRPWMCLFRAADVAARRFALEKLQTIESPDVARALAEQLVHPDRGVREAAVKALAGTKPGRAALADALLKAEHPDAAWSMARALASAADASLSPAVRGKVFSQACTYRDADDRRAEPLFFLLREIDSKRTHDEIVEHALAVRKKKNYAGAVDYLKLLVRDPACGPETRFELAATGLKTSPRDPTPDARNSDPTLAQFAKLIAMTDFDLIGRLSKLKWLDPEELFYLGFHFAERNQREKEFGGQVLGLLIKRSPNSNLARDAKRKLRSEGLGQA